MTDAATRLTEIQQRLDKTTFISEEPSTVIIADVAWLLRVARAAAECARRYNELDWTREDEPGYYGIRNLEEALNAD